MGWWEDLRERWRAFDRAAARSTQEAFEARTGRVLMPVGGVRSLDVDGVRDLVRSGRLPVVEHHWATWCSACMDDLPRVEELHAGLAGRARVIGVCWERFADARAAGEVRAHVERFVHAHGLTFPNAVVDGAPEALIAALALPADTIPLTRVIDPDGGVLRVFHGPLDEADTRHVMELLGGR
ncbi:MAG TPA: hypothetical protein PKA64_13995 [Myxococcota bacterium]|nr:hypothetical protein [Myxococcota bacterium]